MAFTCSPFIAILLSLTIARSSYHCTDSVCQCLDAECHTNCMDGFCQNKAFICSQDNAHCSFDCQHSESCENSTFYMASAQFNIHCLESNSCKNISVNCGSQSNLLPISDPISDFKNNMETWYHIHTFLDYIQQSSITIQSEILASESSLIDSQISCNGNIKNCIITTRNSTTKYAVLDTEFDWYVVHFLFRNITQYHFIKTVALMRENVYLTANPAVSNHHFSVMHHRAINAYAMDANLEYLSLIPYKIVKPTQMNSI